MVSGVPEDPEGYGESGTGRLAHAFPCAPCVLVTLNASHTKRSRDERAAFFILSINNLGARMLCERKNVVGHGVHARRGSDVVSVRTIEADHRGHLDALGTVSADRDHSNMRWCLGS